ncbi:nucleolar protein 11-like [Menidia menidia]
MAALYEGYTLCGLGLHQNLTVSGIQGIEEERDSDHVIVTDSIRSVTLYKVSDQKPLGTWTVKQGQTLTCSAVFNLQTKEYVAVSDNKVIRIWKEEDIILDKAFKATVSADVWMVHCARGGEPLVLFQRGAVRVLDSLLCDPQQPIEEVLAPEETIRWSTSVVAETQQFIIFRTELKGDHFLYLQRLNPSSVQKYRLEGEESGHTPLSFSASYRDKHIHLLYLYPNGHVYQSVISVRAPEADVAAPAVLLPRSLVLSLPGAGDLLEAASAVVLDDAHVAVVGVPHPSAGAGKDFLCIWNTNFQTLQAGKEMGGKIYGQLWSYSNKLFIPHGKTLSVIPFACPKSSLASALGKLKQAKTEESRPLAFVPSWNNILHGDIGRAPKAVEGRKTRGTRETQSAANLTTDQVLELVKTAPVEEVKQGVQGLLSRHDLTDLQPSLGQLVFTLVSRSMADPALYLPGILAQLVQTRYLCHSVCPDLLLLALEKKDYFLCQLCMQVFPDIPEAFTCACLKAFLSLPDVDAEKLSLDPDSVSFMETLVLKELSQEGLQNGFSPTSTKEDYSDDIGGQQSRTDEATPPKEICPVGLHKAVLLNEVLQTAYSDTFLLPHLKDLSSQHVVLFLQYLHYLYLQYTHHDASQENGFRSPSLHQIMDWICMLLDAHFTVLVMTPEAKDLLLNLHRSVQFQVKVFSELGKIEGSLQVLKKMKANRDVGQYSIEVIELF